MFLGKSYPKKNRKTKQVPHQPNRYLPTPNFISKIIEVSQFLDMNLSLWKVLLSIPHINRSNNIARYRAWEALAWWRLTFTFTIAHRSSANYSNISASSRAEVAATRGTLASEKTRTWTLAKGTRNSSIPPSIANYYNPFTTHRVTSSLCLSWYN